MSHRIVVVLLALTAALPAVEAPPNVLVVHSYHVGMPWADGLTTGLGEALAGRAEMMVVQADIKRFPDRAREPAIIANIAAKAATSRPRVVVVFDDYAWDLALRQRDALFPGVPVVFGGVNHWDGKARSGTTGVVEAIDLAPTINLAFHLHPQARRLVVVNDPTETGKANRAVLDDAMHAVGGRTVLHLGDKSFAATEAALAGLSASDDVVLLLSWNLDAHGVSRSYEEAVVRARSACPAPLFGVWSFYMGGGIVGGHLLDARVHGREVGALVTRVLDGEAVDGIPVVARCATRLAFDQRELERFAVPESRLPVGAEVLHRPFSFWRAYGNFALVVIAMLLAQALTIAGLMWMRLRRRSIEDRLRESEARLRRLADNSRDIIFRLDLATLRYEFINTTVETITGRSVAEACATPEFAARVIRPDYLEWVRNQYVSILRGEVPDHLEYPIVRPDGTERWLYERDVIVRDAKGRPVALEGVVTDVTARRDAEEHLRGAQRLDAVGQLARGVAHDLNNVLTPVLGHADLLERKLDGQPDLKRHATTIAAAAQRAAGTVRNLLTFARGRSSSGATCAINKVVEDAVGLLQHSLDRNITINAITDPEAGTVRLGTDDLQQVLVNLAFNARDAMAGGGRLEITTRRCTLDGTEAAHMGVVPGPGVELVVADDGCGMAPAVRDRVFEPFFTTKGAGRGAGLGLSTVYGIVRGAGGGLRVDSTVGQGTRMRIWLPSAPAEAVVGQANPIVPTQARDLRVLLVDDEKLVVDVVRRLLESRGHQVMAFTDPQAAVAWFAGNSAAIDVAVLDGNMPALTGWDCYRKLVALRNGLPAIALTGLLTNEAITAWNKAGVRLIISKPVTPADLDTLLARAVAGV